MPSLVRKGVGFFKVKRLQGTECPLLFRGPLSTCDPTAPTARIYVHRNGLVKSDLGVDSRAKFTD
jgi:hypothetical protein